MAHFKDWKVVIEAAQDATPEEQVLNAVAKFFSDAGLATPLPSKRWLAQGDDGLPKLKKQKKCPDDDKPTDPVQEVACPVDDDEEDDDDDAMKVDQGEDVAVAQVSAVQSGLALAVNLAHNVVLVFGQQLEREGAPDAEKLQIALDLLQQPPLLSAQITSQAYNLVREVRKSCAPSCEELAKFAALATREVLVLHICCTSGSMSDIGFETALEHAFERQLGPEFRSQLHLARSAICRLGRNRTVFERAAPKIFSSTLSSEESQALFTAHAECTTLAVFAKEPAKEWPKGGSSRGAAAGYGAAGYGAAAAGHGAAAGYGAAAEEAHRNKEEAYQGKAVKK